MGKNRTNANKLKLVTAVSSDVQTQLNAKAPLASPTFTGTVTATVTGTASNATKWNNATMYTSTAAASGGVDGDIWFQY